MIRLVVTSLRERVGPYRLLTEIGVGGMGEVYLALAPDGRTVAVKVLHPAVARDAVARRRLEREVATMRRVRSRFVAEVLDADFTCRRPYIVTRYVQGRTLADLPPLCGAELTRLARGLAHALHAIHAAGVVHRDLKPANVILVDGDPVVIDFGLAHLLDATRLTRTGTAIGTPGYLAPEILEGARADAAADIFSWGATVAFAATGHSPYGSGPAQAVFSRVLRARFDLTGLPTPLTALVRTTLSLAPGDRPATADLLETPAAQRVVAPGPRPVRAGRSFPTRGLYGVALLVGPALCYAVPVLALGAILAACFVRYGWDAVARARRRTAAARGGRLARLRAGLGALIAVPLQTAVRFAVLLAALCAGYAVTLAATWFIAPLARGLTLPSGVLALAAVALRVWYTPGRRVRLAVPVLAAAALAITVSGVPFPAWWPLPG